MPKLSVGVRLISRPITNVNGGETPVNRQQLNPCNYVARNLHRSPPLFRGSTRSTRSTFRRWPRPARTRLRMETQQWQFAMTRPRQDPGPNPRSHLVCMQIAFRNAFTAVRRGRGALQNFRFGSLVSNWFLYGFVIVWALSFLLLKFVAQLADLLALDKVHCSLAHGMSNAYRIVRHIRLRIVPRAR